MNMWITASPTTSPSAAHAIRQRLMNPPRAKTVLQITEIEQTIPPAPPKPVYPVREPADAHYEAWLDHLAENDPSLPVADYVKLRCRAHKVSYAEIIGPSQASVHVDPRHLIMFEVSKRYPHLSRYHIGKQFGGRDSTTVYNAHRKYGHIANAQRKVSGETAREIVSLRAQGFSYGDIAKRFGVSKTTVGDYLKRARAGDV